jgi:hypothetical protein
VAALYVEKDGAYFGLPGVDPWDEERDARLYAGPYPVVAHPPCARWCQLASVNFARWGTPIGEDGGCFLAALEAVQEFGGVLEHPANTLAWTTYNLPTPARGYWLRSLFDEAWVTEISQVAYGHPARKRTWLYYVGNNPPPMDWTEPPHTHVVGGGINSGESTWAPRDERSLETPASFRDALLDMARSARIEVAA